MRGRKEQVKQIKESTVDWNDFELVETISFDYDQNKNIAGGELLARIQKHAAMVPKTLEEKIISQPKSKEILQQCHVCRQNILASEMNKHLKTCLGQKKKPNMSESIQGEEVDIRRHLESMSLKRPDIFGTQDNHISTREEGRQEESERKVFFDGQSEKMNRSTGSMAMLMHQQKKIKEENERSSK